MGKIEIYIEFTGREYVAQNPFESGVLATGETIEEVKQKAIDAVQLLILKDFKDNQLSIVNKILQRETLCFCSQCHSTNVQIQVWANPNKTNKSVDDVEGSDGWCEDCMKNTSIAYELIKPIDICTLSKGEKVWWVNRGVPRVCGIYIVRGIHKTGFSPDKVLLEAEDKGCKCVEWAYASQLYNMPKL